MEGEGGVIKGKGRITGRVKQEEQRLGLADE